MDKTIEQKIKEIDEAKNKFVEFLKDNGAEGLTDYKGEDLNVSMDWDYYRSVYGFIGKTFYNVYFMIWDGMVTIDFYDQRSNVLTIDEFLELLA